MPIVGELNFHSGLRTCLSGNDVYFIEIQLTRTVLPSPSQVTQPCIVVVLLYTQLFHID